MLSCISLCREAIKILAAEFLYIFMTLTITYCEYVIQCTWKRGEMKLIGIFRRFYKNLSNLWYEIIFLLSLTYISITIVRYLRKEREIQTAVI